MKINRRSIAAGLTVGVLAGGAAGAVAATSSTTTSTASSTASSGRSGSLYRWGGPGRVDGWGGGAGWGGAGWGGPGWGGPGSGWGGDAGWRGAATGAGWGPWASGTWPGGARLTRIVRSARRAAEAYLGLSASQLGPRLRSGRTLAEIASSRGKSAAGLERAIETAVRSELDADSTLTAGQRSSILAHLSTVVDSVVTGAWPGGPVGPMTGGGW
jgi:hypothetical protein